MTDERLALYTTVYPGVEPYLAAFFASVEDQTDDRFDLWIGSDGLRPEDVAETARSHADASPLAEARWVYAGPGDTPARLRARAIGRMTEAYPAVVFVDSDDVLAPTRVAAARRRLAESDVYGCAMRLCDEAGRLLEPVFAPGNDFDPTALLPHANAFGLTNTAYRSSVLRRCPLVPESCVLVDWFLATHACAAGASFHFDPDPQMAYRQYEDNMAGVLPPFGEARLHRSVARVLHHYDVLLSSDGGAALAPGPLRRAVEASRRDARRFRAFARENKKDLRRYIEALNEQPVPFLWWQWVDHPGLRPLWASPRKHSLP